MSESEGVSVRDSEWVSEHFLEGHQSLLHHPPHLSWGSGFRVQVPGCRVQSSGFRVQGSGFRVRVSGFRVQGSGFVAEGVGFRV